MSSIVNKVKDALHSDKKYDQPEGTSGPHNTRVANAADPRVDSDRDHRANPAGTTTGTTGSGLTGSHGTTGTSGTTGTTGSGLTGSHGTTGTSGTTGNYIHSGSNTTTGYEDPAGTHGPHGSRMANQVDPRVDSDRDHRGAPGSGITGSGITGSHGTTGHGTTGHGTTGEHKTLGKVGATVGGTHGTGPAPNTAGPHKSDALNKVDPRVDSDLDASKTVGGNKTYAQSNTTSGVAKDPTDAAQVPPSVLAQHVGEPSIEHDDHRHDRVRRNSRVSAQDLHRGL